MSSWSLAFKVVFTFVVIFVPLVHVIFEGFGKIIAELLSIAIAPGGMSFWGLSFFLKLFLGDAMLLEDGICELLHKVIAVLTLYNFLSLAVLAAVAVAGTIFIVVVSFTIS